MSVYMEKIIPAADDSCSVCLKEFVKGSEVLGHKVPGTTDNKIHCLIHQTCVLETIGSMGTTKCPTCRRKIKLNSVVSWKTLVKTQREMISKSFLSEIFTSMAGAFLGNLVLKSAMQRPSGGDAIAPIAVAAGLGIVVRGVKTLCLERRFTLTTMDKLNNIGIGAFEGLIPSLYFADPFLCRMGKAALTSTIGWGITYYFGTMHFAFQELDRIESQLD